MVLSHGFGYTVPHVILEVLFYCYVLKYDRWQFIINGCIISFPHSSGKGHCCQGLLVGYKQGSGTLWVWLLINILPLGLSRNTHTHTKREKGKREVTTSPNSEERNTKPSSPFLGYLWNKVLISHTVNP